MNQEGELHGQMQIWGDHYHYFRGKIQEEGGAGQEKMESLELDIHLPYSDNIQFKTLCKFQK